MATLAVTNSFSAGTTIVAADMNENFDDVEAFVNSTPGVVQNDIVDVKGDLIAATAADAVSRLAVGSNTYVLTADSTEATGLKWAAPTTGDITGITTAANSSLAGGTTSGTATLTADVNNTTVATATAADYVLIADTDAANATKKALISDITALVPQGDLTGLTAGTNIDITSASGPVPTITLGIDAAITGTDGQTALDVADGNVTITDTLTVSGGLVAPLAFNAQTGTTYTFVLADAGKMVTFANAGAQTITVPPNSSVAFAVGTQIILQGILAGVVTLVAGAGVTVNSKDAALAIDGQWAAVTLVKTATDVWSLIGALA